MINRLRILLILSLATGAARASTLPLPVTVAECVDVTVTDDPSSCSVSGRDASASGSLTLFPFVSLTAQDFSGPSNDLFIPGAGVFVSVKYSFQVVGGNPGDIVPILIATSLTSNASSFGAAYGFAEAVVTTSFGTTSEVVCTNNTCGTTNTSFFGMFATRAMSGEGGDTIQLEVEAQSGDSALAQTASASADPFIFIDPSFAGAANYSIQVSPGVGNGLADVPEPGTLGLLGCALSILAYLKRRSNRE